MLHRNTDITLAPYESRALARFGGGLSRRDGPTVNGHPLGKGKFLITLRALDRHGNLLGHTKPVILTIH